MRSTVDSCSGASVPPGELRCRRCRGLLEEEDLAHLSSTSQRLSSCSWYYPSFSRHEAKALLQKLDVGTFLLRDSSDSRYAYALSLKTINGVMSIRITYDRGQFIFDCAERVSDRLMRFECAIDLVEFYVCHSSTSPRKLTFVDKEGKNMPMVLLRPALRSLPSLKHLCRLQMNCHLTRNRSSVDSLLLPQSLKAYLAEYPNCV